MDGCHVAKVSGCVDDRSFLSILILDGSGTVTAGGDSAEFKKGDSLFIPAGTGSYEITGVCDALLTTV